MGSYQRLGSVVGVTAPEQGSGGSAASPQYGYGAASGSGAYYDTVNSAPAIAAGGVQAVRFSSTNQQATFAAPVVVPGAGNPAVVFGSSLMIKGNANYLYVRDSADANWGNVFANQFQAIGAQGGTFQGYTSGTLAVPSAMFNFGSNVTGGLFKSSTTFEVGLASHGGTAALWVDTSNQAHLRNVAVSKTGNYTLLTTDTNAVVDNAGAAGSITVTLPAIGTSLGLAYTVYTTAAQIITLTPNASDAIGSKAVGASYACPAAKGNFLAVVAVSANQWAIVSNTGFV